MNKNINKTIKKVLFMVLGIALMSPTFVSARETTKCYAVGYAYSYKYKKYYYSNMSTYRTLGNGCYESSIHARNEWHSYFKSEKRKYYKYTIGAYNSCACNGNNRRAKKYVKRSRNKWKGKFRSKGFRIRKLDEFDPANTYHWLM